MCRRRCRSSSTLVRIFFLLSWKFYFVYNVYIFRGGGVVIDDEQNRRR